MSKKHEAIFDDILGGFDNAVPKPAERVGGTRFLKRSTTIGERLSGELEEKTLHWVDPAECRMWDRHNRDYALLNDDNCRDLIDGIKAQGRQEFPAIVRRLDGSDGYKYEVICGARRHFAISWLQAHNYTQFKYLVEARTLTDEEAFRLSDIENRDRSDISDYERARDYAKAIRLYYDGRQKSMAARLEVSETWLSRYLSLAKLPKEIVAAFASVHDIRELHARTLKPLLANPRQREKMLATAVILSDEQRAGQGGAIDAAKVVARLKASIKDPKRKEIVKRYRRAPEESGVLARRKGRNTVLEVPDSMSRTAVEIAFTQFLDEHYGVR